MISPCKQICLLDASKLFCQVCGRTLQEIAEWSSYTHSQRKEIVKRLKKDTKNELGRSY